MSRRVRCPSFLFPFDGVGWLTLVDCKLRNLSLFVFCYYYYIFLYVCVCLFYLFFFCPKYKVEKSLGLSCHFYGRKLVEQYQGLLLMGNLNLRVEFTECRSFIHPPDILFQVA